MGYAQIKRGLQRYAGILGARESQTNGKQAVSTFRMHIAYRYSSLRGAAANIVLTEPQTTTLRADKLDRSSIARVL